MTGAGATIELTLTPCDFWGFNGTEAWLLDGEDRSREKPPNFNPVRERRIEWGGQGHGTVTDDRLFVPGTGIKGPIAHRVAFHANRRARAWANKGEGGSNETFLDRGEIDAVVGEDNEAVRDLFGCIHGKKDSKVHAGRVFIDDILLEPKDYPDDIFARIMHNSIDRFTGGVRGGILFEERVIYGGPPLVIQVHVERIKDIDDASFEALGDALRDLAEGRLPLGAGAGRGHGRFETRASRRSGMTSSPCVGR